MRTQSAQKWNRVLLKDAVTFKTGKLNSNAAVKNGKYPFFTCSQDVYKTNTYSFDTECVLLGGNNADAVYPIFYFKGKFDAYQRTYVIESKDNSVRYLYYVLKEKLNELRSRSTGSATKFLTLKILNQIPVLLPDFSTQHRIVDVLSAYDDLIDINNRRIEILEQLIIKIYDEWCINGKTETRTTTLGAIASLTKKKYDDKRDSGLPLVDMSRMKSGSLSMAAYGSASELTTSRILFEINDILFGSIRPYLHKVALAAFSGVTNTSVLVIRANEKQYQPILAAILFRKETIQWATQYSTGTKMPVIKWDYFKTMPVVVPSGKYLEQFAEIVSPILEHINTLSREIHGLKTTRDLLIPKLVNDEIKV